MTDYPKTCENCAEDCAGQEPPESCIEYCFDAGKVPFQCPICGSQLVPSYEGAWNSNCEGCGIYFETDESEEPTDGIAWWKERLARYRHIEITRLRADLAEALGLLEKLLDHPLDYEGLCQHCGDYVDKDHDKNHVDDCPAVKARALLEKEMR